MNPTRAIFAVVTTSLAIAGCSPASDESVASGTRSIEAAPGSGLKAGLVTGRIYDDLDANLGDRMRDFATLGVKVLRVEIEGNDYAKYRRIVSAARRYDIDVLALVAQGAAGDPLAGSLEWFDTTYVPQYIDTVNRLVSAIPDIGHVEVWNEPDVYGFRPIGEGDHAYRYALLASRVFESFHEQKARGGRAPLLLAFDFSRQDDGGLLDLVYNQPPIQNHRSAYRPGRLPDGLPADIVSIHGYGDFTKQPDEPGYAYGNKTFADAVDFFLTHKFADGRSVLNETPVWYTELSFDTGRIGGEANQARAIETAYGVLAQHREITAAFYYGYRDDEGSGGERGGLRKNSGGGFGKHASYGSYQRVSGASYPSRPTFSDVGFDHWAHDAIEALYARGITTGCRGSFGDGTLAFCEQENLTTSELATLLDRAQGKPATNPEKSPAASREDMAVALANAIGAWEPSPRGVFTDVPSSHPHAHEIEGLASRGIARGFDLGDGRREFRPDASLTRAEMATFLSRGFDLR